MQSLINVLTQPQLERAFQVILEVWETQQKPESLPKALLELSPEQWGGTDRNVDRTDGSEGNADATLTAEEIAKKEREELLAKQQAAFDKVMATQAASDAKSDREKVIKEASKKTKTKETDDLLTDNVYTDEQLKRIRNQQAKAGTTTPRS